jgi:hypothetical protein
MNHAPLSSSLDDARTGAALPQQQNTPLLVCRVAAAGSGLSAIEVE